MQRAIIFVALLKYWLVIMFADEKRLYELHSRSIAYDALFPFLWGAVAWFGGRLFLFVIFGLSDFEGFCWAAAHWFLVVINLFKANKRHKRLNWFLIMDMKAGKVSVDVWRSKGRFFVMFITTVIYVLGALFTFSELPL